MLACCCKHYSESMTAYGFNSKNEMQDLAPRYVLRLMAQNPVPDQQLDWLTVLSSDTAVPGVMCKPS